MRILLQLSLEAIHCPSHHSARQPTPPSRSTDEFITCVHICPLYVDVVSKCAINRGASNDLETLDHPLPAQSNKSIAWRRTLLCSARPPSKKKPCLLYVSIPKAGPSHSTGAHHAMWLLALLMAVFLFNTFPLAFKVK